MSELSYERSVLKILNRNTRLPEVILDKIMYYIPPSPIRILMGDSVDLYNLPISYMSLFFMNLIEHVYNDISIKYAIGTVKGERQKFVQRGNSWDGDENEGYCNANTEECEFKDRVSPDKGTKVSYKFDIHYDDRSYMEDEIDEKKEELERVISSMFESKNAFKLKFKNPFPSIIMTNPDGVNEDQIILN
jgi:hypothetical protein